MKALFLGLALGALVAGAASAAENGVDQATPAAAAPAAANVRVGALIKDDKGVALGRVTRVIKATATEPAKVSFRIGDENHTILQTQLTTKDGALVYTPPANVTVRQPFSN